MRRKFGVGILLVAFLHIGATPRTALAQQTISLEDQLKAQYTMVKMGADSSGPAVVEQGTVLVVKKGGILGVPYGDQSILSTKYENGTVHSPNALVSKGIGSLMSKMGKQQTTQFFQANNKVYPSKLAVNLQKDQVLISIVDCDSCNNVDPKTFFKADVVFQFPKGTLATANPSQVEDTIAGLLAIDDSNNNQDQANNQGGNGGGNDQGGGNQGGGNQGGGGGGNQGGGQDQPPAQPQQIEKGQTPDQVTAAIGQPDKIVNLGAKQIYVYKDIKVTFINGKVSDVQ
jgi:uncharacterized membrane protein YgcG